MNKIASILSLLFPLLLLLGLATIFPAHAAGTDAELLQGIERQLQSAPVIRGEFQQTRRLAQIKKPLVSNGRFLVARDVGVIWETLAPLAQTLRLTKDEIAQTDGTGQRTLMKLSADKEPLVRLINGVLFSLFSGDVAALARFFEYRGQHEGATWRIEFTPKDANLARLIRVLRLEGGRDVALVEMESAAGDLTQIRFTAQTHGAALTDAEQKRFE
jgi:hypothetical protein